MSKTHRQHTQKLWQPLNRKSQILITIVVLTVAAFQICSWYTHSVQLSPSQPQPTQEPPKK